MKKIKLEITAEGAQVMHGAVQKRLEDVSQNASVSQAGQVEKALLQEANRELADALTKHNLRPQDG